MDLTSGLLIGRIRGIAIRVHWSWIFIFTLVTWALANSIYAEEFTDWSSEQRWIAAAATAVAFFTSVLLHELSHAFVALGYGMRVPSITLFIFGGVSNIDGEMESPGQEFRIAIAGPAMSAALAVLFVLVGLVAPNTNLAGVLIYLGLVNGLLAIFNLLPGFPLDGGRVFRSIVWRRTGDLTRATRVAAGVGNGIGWFLIGLGIFFVFLTGNLLNGWYALIGLFLKTAADGAYQQVLLERTLRGVQASDVMRPPPDPVPEETSLQAIVDERVLSRGERAMFLDRNGRITGLITTTDLAKVARDRLATTRALDVMVAADDVITVQPDTTVMEAMRLMTERDIHQVPVLEDGHMVGLLSRGDVLQQIEARMRFVEQGAEPPKPDEVLRR